MPRSLLHSSMYADPYCRTANPISTRQGQRVRDWLTLAARAMPPPLSHRHPRRPQLLNFLAAVAWSATGVQRR